MPRNMSFSLTTAQVTAGTKTVTRRKGWKFLKAGDLLNACEKCMGLRPGEKINKLALLRVTDVRREPLDAIIDEGQDGADREGFPLISPQRFVEFFCEHMGGDPSQEVSRIEFEYVKEECDAEK